MSNKTGTELPKETPPPTSVEEEFSALGMMIEAMEKLDKDARSRVLTYLKERFEVYLPN